LDHMVKCLTVASNIHHTARVASSHISYAYKNIKHSLMFHCLEALECISHEIGIHLGTHLNLCFYPSAACLAGRVRCMHIHAHCSFMAWQQFNAAVDHYVAPSWYLTTYLHL
jgi:hypothetical protein